MSQNLFIIPGDCLFPRHDKLEAESGSLFFMAEDHGLCTRFKYHKQKLLLFLSAMRSHADKLKEDHELVYFDLEHQLFRSSYAEKVEKAVKENKIKNIVTYKPNDKFFEKELSDIAQELECSINFVDSPSFIFPPAEFEVYLEDYKPFMHTWYQRQRKAEGILVDEEDKPLHGKWSFDEENRKKLPKDIEIPELPQLGLNDHSKNLKPLIEKHFSDHPGSLENFNWPTERAKALEWMQKFFDERFEKFGPYEDAVESDEVFLFHSTLSPLINLGLLTPKEVLDKALEFGKEKDVHYPSLEGFVRQIMGWREFIKGCYDHLELKGNYFKHKRKLKKCWYDGTTGIPPIDDSIKKANQYGYTHHIERLMILGNAMLLCEIHPDEVYKWFMEMFVDSADWVMVPNVYGMSQFADGGTFATKPYIGGSNYIRKMSHYSKGDWCDVFDGLYWRFIGENKEVFAKNQRMSMMVRTFDRLKEERKNRIIDAAEEFIEKTSTH